MRRCLSTTGLLLTVVVSACGTRPTLPGMAASATLRVRSGAITREVPLEEYVAGAALAELHPAAGDSKDAPAMFEVQTIIARTYARAHRGRHSRDGFDLCATTHCQIYDPARLTTSRWASVARAAAARTAGTILWYAGAPADAVYHADCGGHTSAAADVWGSTRFPYLRAQRDDGIGDGAHEGWRYAVEADLLQRVLDRQAGMRVGRRLTAIVVATRDRSGRAQRVILRGAREVSVTGAELRQVLSAAFGPKSLRSTRFDVTSAQGRFLFSGTGFGHGVGLCQAGARARLAAGNSPRAVLQRYYPGTALALGGDSRVSGGGAPD